MGAAFSLFWGMVRESVAGMEVVMVAVAMVRIVRLATWSFSRKRTQDSEKVKVLLPASQYAPKMLTLLVSVLY